ncbi:hypothetical protein [Ruegeria sp.]|uniref:hypothetical protein n=1 Tax=Ruegeria sp. TaxID=1879320 RepID=UPI003C7E32F3
MVDYPTSPASADGYRFIAGKLWRTFQAYREERVKRQKLDEALRELNSAHLRDIGYIREGVLDAGNSQSESKQPGSRIEIFDMTF